ncbi:uncharacterized protein FOMMEDRAFT_153516 [Fomitiporia mediterranea MF3/22]|uniref:uncharacterized protein n=1 Tax=Fomitiporia mediterranea (strain MF3/22) TaxID=694068 RepID=UPI0004408B76|nr:uncharacterized protein FOMMEDRAFT_153516 [Fomitiporia mediterranea MF3/22]EJD06136.1 hypothetical protein FOMMEDRAFT_153516 [Fomitiporia mediterranea MF3/22]
MIQEDYYKTGRDLLEQRQYVAAFNAFDKAARENKKNAPIFHLIIPIIETYIQILEPSRRSQKFLDDSLKIINAAAESVDEEDVSLVDRWMEIMKELGSRPCYFSKLPIETKTGIFALIIDVNDTKKFTLSLVCRAWRDIINGSPRFWRNLVLTPKTSQKQADAWLQRSGGTLSSLHITGGFSFSSRPDMLREANPSIWSRLDTLKLISKKAFRIDSLPQVAVGKLNLKELELHIDRLSTGTWQARSKMGRSRLRHLVLCAASGEAMTTNLLFTSLTTLRLHSPFSAKDTLSFLKGTPMLESLFLTSSSTRHLSTERIDFVELAYLRHLELHLFMYTIEYLQHVRSPNVRTLNIIYAGDVLVMPQNLTQLEDLYLLGCTLVAHAFVSLLRAAASLKALRIPLCYFRDADVNAVIGELAKPVSTDEGKQAASRAHLPSVASLKNELGSSSSSEESPGEPLRILTLILDDCPQFERNAIPWLQSVVPELSHELTQK